MARTPKTPTPKEPVKLRWKQLASGNKSLYLDTCADGRRRYEFLKLYLIPETDAAARMMNANTMRAANAIKAQRIIDLANRKAGIKPRSAGDKITLGAFLAAYRQKHGEDKGGLMACLGSHLKKWRLDAVKLSQIDREFCAELIARLKRSGLKETSQNTYLRRFSALMSEAVRADLIEANPLTKIDPRDRPKEKPKEREFLTPEEVQSLIDTPERNEATRTAFLLACFCGLRVSDLRALTWANVRTEAGRTVLHLRMQKTQREIILPLSPEACRWLRPRAKYERDTDPVFYLCDKVVTYRHLRRWAKAAGIKKTVTWHTARHTFATMLITFGADLYTVSKLLGHSDIKTTQIYARLVDEKKAAAVDLMSGKFH